MKTECLSTTLLSCAEVQLQFKRPLFESMISIHSARDAVSCLRQFYDPGQIDLREFFWLITLTNSNRVISISEVTSGSSKGVMVSPKLIFQQALITNASALIVAHNHPSGTLKISANDRTETRNLKSIAELLEITLLDHLIISSESYISMAYKEEM